MPAAASQWQAGQTLIETIAAIFLLTMALTSAIGLSIYAFSASTISQKQVIATSLAAEGVDVIRMMRDSNWLAGAAKGGSYDLKNCPDIGDKPCYQKAYEKVPPYNNYDLNTGNRRLSFDVTSRVWSLSNTQNYDLYLQGNGTYTHSNNGTTPIFARMINISLNSAAPFSNQNSNQELIVKSVVAWRDKKCPNFNSNQDLLALVSICKTMTEQHFTNWKDYK